MARPFSRRLCLSARPGVCVPSCTFRFEFPQQSTYSGCPTSRTCAFTKRESRERCASPGVPMKDVYKVLQQKEDDLARVRREVESLHIVASLLATQSATEESAENFDEMAKKPASSAEESLEPAEETQA